MSSFHMMQNHNYYLYLLCVPVYTIMDCFYKNKSILTVFDNL